MLGFVPARRGSRASTPAPVASRSEISTKDKTVRYNSHPYRCLQKTHAKSKKFDLRPGQPAPLRFSDRPPAKLQDGTLNTIGYRAWTHVMRARYPNYTASHSEFNHFMEFQRVMNLKPVFLQRGGFQRSYAVAPKEFEPLLMWMSRSDDVFTRDELMQEVYGLGVDWKQIRGEKEGAEVKVSVLRAWTDVVWEMWGIGFSVDEFSRRKFHEFRDAREFKEVEVRDALGELVGAVEEREISALLEFMRPFAK